MPNKNSSASDVAVFYNNATTDVEFKCNCYITNNLSVLGTSLWSNRLTVMCDGYSGIIRCVPLVDTSESSLTSYRYTDMRLTAAGDMWLKDNN